MNTKYQMSTSINHNNEHTKKTVGQLSLLLWLNHKNEDKMRISSINDNYFWMLLKKYCILVLFIKKPQRK